MLDLFPAGVLDILNAQFGNAFQQMNEICRLALATTLSERRLTHARLCELTEAHSSDVTKTLRDLVTSGYLVSEGAGRGSVYRFAGTPVIAPEDVFSEPGLSNSGSDSLNLPESSLNLPPGSLNLVKAEETRDSQGRLLSEHFQLPLVDSLDALSATFLAELEQKAEAPRSAGKVAKELMAEIIQSLCDSQYIRLDCLATLVERRPNTLQSQYLTKMCRNRSLRMAFPDNPNHSQQAYTKVKKSNEH